MIMRPLEDLSELNSLDYADRRQLPEVSAVYFVIGADDVIDLPAESVLYVGETKNLRKRFRSHNMTHLAKHRKSSNGWLIAWAEVSEAERKALELACILHWRPHYSRDMHALPAMRLLEAQAMARHSDPATTQIYFHQVRRIENAAEKRISYGVSADAAKV
jgi:excinuclease UvrABC nuclease subunit